MPLRAGPMLGLAMGTVAVLLVSGLAQASTVDAQGNLAWEPDALLTFGFESLADATRVSASWTAWGTAANGHPTLVPTAVSAATWSPALVTGNGALEGQSALRLGGGATMALALIDQSFFETLTAQRISVSMWGRAYGAEPELDVVFPSRSEPVGPDGFGHVIALRTGNETSDGWVEYSTGPIDGALFGEAIGAILLTARVATTTETFPLDNLDFAPGEINPTIVDPGATAVVDAVEVDPVPGALVGGATCTLESTSACQGGECAFGECVDGAIVWGAVPQSAQHRTDLVHRLELEVEYLQGAREAAAAAPSIFTSAFVASTTSATTSTAFYGALNEAVAGIRNGHTTLGHPIASGPTAFYPLVDPWGNPWSGYLDVCLGLAQDDLPTGTGASTYAVYWMAAGSAVAGTLHVGDMLTEVDGMAPDAWVTAMKARYSPMLPDDPASEPTGRGTELADLLSRFATSATFSSCTAAGACTTVMVAPAKIAHAILTGAGPSSATTFSRTCSPRFVDAISTWTPADDDAPFDVPQYAQVGGLATVELDGFQGAEDTSDPSDPYHAWAAPFDAAFAAGTNVLIDARQGHGGAFVLGNWLAQQIRGTADPYDAFAAPRGDFDLADPAWLFDPSLAACLGTSSSTDTMCGWISGAASDSSTLASPPAGAVKVAWVNGNDLSMNDITPWKLKGAANVQIFGPHPTTGAVGEVSDLPPIVGSYKMGSLQTLDIRFGQDFATAVASPWATGTGVPPDQVVTQKVSDLLTGHDTVLEAARAWLLQ